LAVPFSCPGNCELKSEYLVEVVLSDSHMQRLSETAVTMQAFECLLVVVLEPQGASKNLLLLCCNALLSAKKAKNASCSYRSKRT
jgi:hypothetical protein